MNLKEKKNRKKKNPKQTTRTGIESEESEKWTSHGGFSVGRGREGIVGRRYRD